MGKSHGDDIRLKKELENKINQTEDLQEYEDLIKQYKKVCSLLKESRHLMKESLRRNV